jgi:hypothetical protein
MHEKARNEGWTAYEAAEDDALGVEAAMEAYHSAMSGQATPAEGVSRFSPSSDAGKRDMPASSEPAPASPLIPAATLANLEELVAFLERETMAAAATDCMREHDLMVWAAELRGLLAKITGSGEEA